MGNALYQAMFPAPTPTYGPGDIAALRMIEGVPCLWWPARRPRGTIVYLHANGVDLGHIQGVVHALVRATRMSVVAPEYPGYGIAPGPVSPYDTVAHATRVFNYFARRKRRGDTLLLMGRSIGTGVAMQAVTRPTLAAPPDGVVLISPFASIEGVARRMLGDLGGEIARGMYDSVGAARRSAAPLLVMTGRFDTLTPVDEGRRVAEASAAAYRRFLVLPTSDHNVLDWHGIHAEVNRMIDSVAA